MVLSGLSELSNRFEKSKLAQSLSTIATEKDTLAKKKNTAAAILLAKVEAERAKATQLAAAKDTKGAMEANKQAAALERKAQAAIRASVALNLAGKATGALAKGMAALGGPLGIAMIAFSVASTLLGNYQQQMEEARQKEAEAAKEATSTATTSIEAVSD